MKTKLFLMTMIAASTLAGCGSPAGVPVEFANACTMENEKKVIEVSGFLDTGGSVFCSNIGGGRLECGFKLKENPADEKNFSVYIEQGSSANSVEKLPSGYKKEDIKIRDNGGNIIGLSDKVKLTGKMSIGPGGVPCFLQVNKIEK